MGGPRKKSEISGGLRLPSTEVAERRALAVFVDVGEHLAGAVVHRAAEMSVLIFDRDLPPRPVVNVGNPVAVRVDGRYHLVGVVIDRRREISIRVFDGDLPAVGIV
jgi:hypothetical protein